MAVTASGAAARVVSAFVQSKPVKAKPETIAARREICLACEFCKTWEKDSAYHRCTKCGCWLDGKYFAKMNLATEQCPINKWGTE